MAIDSAHSTCVRKSSPLAAAVAVAEDAWRATPGRPALLALPLLQAAVATLADMSTADEAGVSAALAPSL